MASGCKEMCQMVIYWNFCCTNTPLNNLKSGIHNHDKTYLQIILFWRQVRLDHQYQTHIYCEQIYHDIDPAFSMQHKQQAKVFSLGHL